MGIFNNIFGTNRRKGGVDVIREEGFFAFGKLNNEHKMEALKWAENIVNEYASVVEIHSSLVEDVAVLPHSKKDIINACSLMIMACFLAKDKEQEGRLKTLLITVPNFQNIDDEDKKYTGHFESYILKYSRDMKELMNAGHDISHIASEIQRIIGIQKKYQERGKDEADLITEVLQHLEGVKQRLQ